MHFSMLGRHPPWQILLAHTAIGPLEKGPACRPLVSPHHPQEVPARSTHPCRRAQSRSTAGCWDPCTRWGRSPAPACSRGCRRTPPWCPPCSWRHCWWSCRTWRKARSSGPEQRLRDRQTAHVTFRSRKLCLGIAFRVNTRENKLSTGQRATLTLNILNMNTIWTQSTH